MTILPRLCGQMPRSRLEDFDSEIDSVRVIWLCRTTTLTKGWASVTTAYVIITAYVIFNRLRDKKSTAYVIPTACVIKI